MKTNRSPEVGTHIVVGKHIERDTGINGEHFTEERGYRLRPNSLVSVAARNKELAQIDAGVGFSAKKGVGNRPASILKQYCAIAVFSQPATHTLGQFGNGHRVAVPLIPDELVVHLSKDGAI